VVEFETNDNSVLLVADSRNIISHEDSPTVDCHGDEFYPEDCMLQPGWVPYDRRLAAESTTVTPEVLNSMEEL
jgi:hypothetical protein